MKNIHIVGGGIFIYMVKKKACEVVVRRQAEELIHKDDVRFILFYFIQAAIWKYCKRTIVRNINFQKLHPQFSLTYWVQKLNTAFNNTLLIINTIY